MIRRSRRIFLPVVVMILASLGVTYPLGASSHKVDSVPIVQGAWEGTMSHGTDSFSPTWKLIFLFQQEGATITGSTRIDAPPNFAVFALKGRLRGQVLTAVEGAILEEESSELRGKWCRSRSMKLTLVGDDQLEGTWNSPTSGCSGGKIVARRMKNGQRDKAERLACSAPAGSLGKEAICPNFDSLFVWLIGNECSRRVGDLYEQNKKTLESPATDANIEKWADMETKYFQEEEDCTAWLGRRYSREKRVKLMKDARDRHSHK